MEFASPKHLFEPYGTNKGKKLILGVRLRPALVAPVLAPRPDGGGPGRRTNGPVRRRQKKRLKE